MDQFELLKSHVDAYTKTDGTVVQAHDDKRVAASKAPPIATHAAALAASSKPGDLDHWDNQVAAGYMAKGDHKGLASHIKNLDTAARDHILDHVHPDHREGLGFKQLNMDRSQKQYAEKFPAKAGASPAGGESQKKYQVRDPSGNVHKVFHGENAEHEARQHIHKNQDKKLSLRDVTPK